MKCYLACKEAGYGTIAFDVREGAVITEEYSETLDSATISLRPTSIRLESLRPYQEVKLAISDVSSLFFLVDNFTESQLFNKEGEKLYSYQIALMSETKYLEKVQLPNFCVTHEAKTRKTLYEVLVRLMKYVPKIKFSADGETWAYKPLLTLDDSATFKTRFASKCADLQMSQPTLRQALTSVMSQEGCIPVVKNRVVTFLDLKQAPEESGLDEKSLIVTRSQSSDAYVNSLANLSGNMLDRTGKAVSEQLCFRDRDNLLLKSLENLKLETRFPIYSVEKLVAHAFFTGTIAGAYPIVTSPTFVSGILRIPNSCFVLKDSELTIGWTGTSPAGMSGRIKGTLYALLRKVGSFGIKWEKLKSKAIDYSWAKGKSFAFAKTTSDEQANVQGYIDEDIFGYDDFGFYLSSLYSSREDVGIFFVGTITATTNGGTTGNPIDFPIMISSRMQGGSPNDGLYVYGLYSVSLSTATPVTYENGYLTNPDGKTPAAGQVQEWAFVDDANDARSLDITDLCFESDARSGLSQDYVELNGVIEDGATPVSTLAKYYYSTVEYSIGGTEISGFSQEYKATNGWWSDENSVAENICIYAEGWESIYKEDGNYGRDDIADAFGGIFDEYADLTAGTAYEFKKKYYEHLASTFAISDYNGYFTKVSGDVSVSAPWGTSKSSYASMYFDVTYKPISSPALRFTRGDGAFPIEQLDSKQDGLSSVERVSLSEYESVERLGSDVLCIHQRGGVIASLNSLFDGYTIFKREIACREGYFETDYYASKNYVLKNYFTSIMTKYRAYQYVDYSQSVTRLECVHEFLEIWDVSTEDRKALLYGSDRIGIRRDSLKASMATRPYDLCLIDGFEYGLYGDGTDRTIENGYNANSVSATSDGLVKSYRLYDSQIVAGSAWYLDESAIIHSDKFFALTMKDFSNATRGIYVDGTYIPTTDDETSSTALLGGIPQRYYTGEMSPVEVGFSSQIAYLKNEADFYEVQALPHYLPYKHRMGRYVIYVQGDAVEGSRGFYLPAFEKDNAELLSVTFDFEVRNYVPWLEFNENMISHSTLLSSGLDEDYDGIYVAHNDDSLYPPEEAHPRDTSPTSWWSLIETEDKPFEFTGGKFSVNFDNYESALGLSSGSVNSITICIKHTNADGTSWYEDVCRITRDTTLGTGESQVMTAKVNDTIGTRVWSESETSLLVDDMEATLGREARVATKRG